MIIFYLSLKIIYAYNVINDFLEDFMKKILCCLFGLCICSSTTLALDDALYKKYKHVSSDDNVIKAIEMLEETSGKYSKDAILGKNLTGKPIKVEFAA